jgi:hypothetical protein
MVLGWAQEEEEGRSAHSKYETRKLTGAVIVRSTAKWHCHHTDHRDRA